MLTIFNPCILPVLFFVFARSDQSFLRSGLPLLGGMAETFVLVTSLAMVGGWAMDVIQWGRIAAVVLTALLGAVLLLARGKRLSRPVVALGNHLSRNAGDGRVSIASSLVLRGGNRAAVGVMRRANPRHATDSRDAERREPGQVIALPPIASRGVDVDAGGRGVAAEERLYHLLRLKAGVTDHTFKIHYVDAGVVAYSLTLD